MVCEGLRKPPRAAVRERSWVDFNPALELLGLPSLVSCRSGAVGKSMLAENPSLPVSSCGLWARPCHSLSE